MNTILVGFGALYLPWVLISRQAFIYHFFPCVIFVTLAIAYGLREILKRYPIGKNTHKGIFGMRAGAVYCILPRFNRNENSRLVCGCTHVAAKLVVRINF